MDASTSAAESHLYRGEGGDVEGGVGSFRSFWLEVDLKSGAETTATRLRRNDFFSVMWRPRKPLAPRWLMRRWVAVGESSSSSNWDRAARSSCSTRRWPCGVVEIGGLEAGSFRIAAVFPRPDDPAMRRRFQAHGLGSQIVRELRRESRGERRRERRRQREGAVHRR